MKPTGKSQGKGIFLINKLAQITQWKSEYRWKPDNPQCGRLYSLSHNAQFRVLAYCS